MYEAMTYEYILNRMLSRVSDTVDKREGGVICAALAPAAVELAQMYVEMEVNLRLGFATTSSGEYLALRAEEMGIKRAPATRARRRGLFYASGSIPMDVPVGSRYSIEAVNYVVLGRIDKGQFVLECEKAGEIGNMPVGDMLPIDHVAGLARAQLAEILTAGNEEESDEKLLDEYQLRVRQPATSGNIHQYKQWALEVAGVGAARIFPLWDGPGTVKVVIVDTDRQPAGAAIVAETAAHIETVRPVGAAVTVVSGTGKAMNVSAVLTLAAGYTLQEAVEGFTQLLADYLKSIAFEVNYVSYARIGTLLLSVPGVLDYAGMHLNGGTGNVELLDEEIPVLGPVELEV